jgi:alpha-tubulin suppressor-like RCC1 family protein
MNFKKYFISIIFIALIISTSSFAGQKLKALRISGGEQLSLVVAENRQAFSAGYPQGRTGSPYAFARVTDGEKNTTTGFFEDANQVAAGWVHALILDDQGNVWSYGDDTQGELGNGPNEGSSSDPCHVHGGDQGTPFLRYIKQVSAGRSGEHSLAIDSNFCYAWGRNIEGQCAQGPGAQDSYQIPKKVLAGQQNPSHPADPCYPLRYIIAVFGGEHQSMALDANGFVYMWGSNHWGDGDGFFYAGFGKLGTGDEANDIQTVPQIVHAGEQNTSHPDYPLQNIVAISAGWTHSMALEKYVPGDPNYKGRVLTWGNNYYGYSEEYNCTGGRLGNGTITNSSRPVFVKAGQQNPAHPNDFNLEGIIAIAAGESHSMALAADGTIFCWGDNNYNQCGNGKGTWDYGDHPYAHELTPVKVLGFNAKGYLSNITAISAGYWHCLALDSSGQIWAWGEGLFGKLAIGTQYNKSTPYPVPLYIPSESDPNVRNITKNKNYGNIYSAVNDSCTVSGDTIEVYPGVYLENVSDNNKCLTLKSSDPNDPFIVAQTIISGSSSTVTLFNNSTLSGFTISNNVGNTYGVYCFGASPTITNCAILDNGYGVCCESFAPTIANCTITYSQSHGILLSGAGAAKILNNLLISNTGYGIAIYDPTGEAAVRNNTISRNLASGIYWNNSGAEPNISSNIIWGNDSGSFDGSFGNVNYNCVQGGYPGTDNISSDPCFVSAADYHLKNISPCIDKGDPCFNSSTEKDIDGGNRVIDGNCDGSTRVDIGADEFCPLFDLLQDGFVNFLDFAVFAKSWAISQGEANYNYLCDYSPDSKIDYKDLKIFCAHWLCPFDGNDIGGEGAYFAENSSSGEGGEMMAMQQPEQEAAEMTMELPEDEQQSMMAGEGETAAVYLISDVNEPNSGDEVTVQIYTDTPLFCMGLIITVMGDANITGAVSTADCNEYGWDPDWPTDPYIDPEGWLYISGVSWEGQAEGVVGYLKFRYNSGEVTVSIIEGDAFDAYCEPALISGEILTFGADPNGS